MEGILPHTAGNTFTVKPASTMVAQESGASSSSSNVWDTFRKAGETLDDSFSKSASDWGSKVSSLFDQGKQKLQEWFRSEEHTSELQSRFDIVCRILLEKKNKP